MYDAIVIGAGPTGSIAAKTLAQQGAQVLLVERMKLPRNKSCSGVLIQKTLDLLQLYLGETVPDAVQCTPTDNRGMIFTTDSGKTYRFEQGGLNIWRNSFDHWLATKAVESGAALRDATVAVGCEQKEDHVEVTLHSGRHYTEQARFLLDCEGVTSALKRKLQPSSPQFVTTFQTFYQGSIALDPHYFYAYLQPQLSEYDAWFNVKDQQLVIGVSAHHPHTIAAYHSRFLAYLKEQHQLQLARALRSEKWLMPRILPGCPIDYGFGRILFAGEAAGFLNPMGEGISAGIESGYCAACAIWEHLQEPEAVQSSYRQLTNELHHYMLRQWRFVGKLADTFHEMV